LLVQYYNVEEAVPCSSVPVHNTEEVRAPDGPPVLVKLGNRHLKIPWRFLSWQRLSAGQACNVGRDALYAQFWFPGLHPTQPEFWYRREQFVKNWTPHRHPSEQAVVQLVSLEPYHDKVPPKFSNAQARIDETLRLYERKNIKLIDDLGLQKLTSPELLSSSQFWIGEYGRDVVFISCHGDNSLPRCIGFVNFDDLRFSA
jgi:hypothetical protein